VPVRLQFYWLDDAGTRHQQELWLQPGFREEVFPVVVPPALRAEGAFMNLTVGTPEQAGTGPLLTLESIEGLPAELPAPAPVNPDAEDRAATPVQRCLRHFTAFLDGQKDPDLVLAR